MKIFFSKNSYKKNTLKKRNFLWREILEDEIQARITRRSAEDEIDKYQKNKTSDLEKITKNNIEKVLNENKKIGTPIGTFEGNIKNTVQGILKETLIENNQKLEDDDYLETLSDFQKDLSLIDKVLLQNTLDNSGSFLGYFHKTIKLKTMTVTELNFLENVVLETMDKGANAYSGKRKEKFGILKHIKLPCIGRLGRKKYQTKSDRDKFLGKKNDILEQIYKEKKIKQKKQNNINAHVTSFIENGFDDTEKNLWQKTKDNSKRLWNWGKTLVGYPEETPAEIEKDKDKRQEEFFNFFQKIKNTPQIFLNNPNSFKINGRNWRTELNIPKNISDREFLDATRNLYLKDILTAEELDQQTFKDVTEINKNHDEILDLETQIEDLSTSKIPSKISILIEGTNYTDHIEKLSNEGIHADSREDENSEVNIKELVEKLEEKLIDPKKLITNQEFEEDDIESLSDIIKLHCYLGSITNPAFANENPHLAREVKKYLEKLKKEYVPELDESEHNQKIERIRTLKDRSQNLLQNAKSIFSLSVFTRGHLNLENLRNAIASTDEDFDKYTSPLQNFADEFKNIFESQLSNSELTDEFKEKFSDEEIKVLNDSWEFKELYNLIVTKEIPYSSYDHKNHRIDKKSTGILDFVNKQKIEKKYAEDNALGFNFTTTSTPTQDAYNSKINTLDGNISDLDIPEPLVKINENSDIKAHIKDQELEKHKAFSEDKKSELENKKSEYQEKQTDLLEYQPIGSEFSEFKFLNDQTTNMEDVLPASLKVQLIKATRNNEYHFKNDGHYIILSPHENGGYKVEYWQHSDFEKEHDDYKDLLKIKDPAVNNFKSGKLENIFAHGADDSVHFDFGI